MRVTQTDGVGSPTGVVRVRIGNIVPAGDVACRRGLAEDQLLRGSRYQISATYLGDPAVAGSAGVTRVRIEK